MIVNRPICMMVIAIGPAVFCFNVFLLYPFASAKYRGGKGNAPFSSR